MSKDLPPEDGGDVGYGKPPEQHKFAKGNKLGGRRLGSKNKPKSYGLNPFEKLCLEVGDKVLANGRPMDENVVLAQAKNALGGGTNAQNAYINRQTKLREKKLKFGDDMLDAFETRVRQWERYVEDAEPEDRLRAERIMIPHPLDIEVDPVGRKIWVRGPICKRERDDLNALLAEMSAVGETLTEMRSELEVDPTSWPLQQTYTIMMLTYLNVRDSLPERYKPSVLPRWEAGDAIPWWYLDPLSEKLARRRRRSTGPAKRGGRNEKLSRYLKPFRRLWERPIDLN